MVIWSVIGIVLGVVGLANAWAIEARRLKRRRKLRNGSRAMLPTWKPIEWRSPETRLDPADHIVAVTQHAFAALIETANAADPVWKRPVH